MNAALAVAISLLPSAIKPFVYRRLGMAIGRDVRVGFLALLHCDRIELGDGVRIAPLVRLRCRQLRLGARSSVGSLVKASLHTLHAGSQCTISGPNDIAGDPDDPRSVLVMGPASWILPYCYVNVAREIRMGRNVGVGGGSHLFTHGLWLSRLDGYPTSFGSITLGNDVWLPWGCFLMPGVKVGDGAVVGARSVINKDVPARALAAGVPAKVIRDHANQTLTAEQRLQVLQEITEDFARQRNLPFSVHADGPLVVHRVGDVDVLCVHTGTEPEPDSLRDDALNVTFTPIDDALASRRPCWSLSDYRSSSHHKLPELARGWLAHARIAGVRYYPIDEDPIE